MCSQLQSVGLLCFELGGPFPLHFLIFSNEMESCPEQIPRICRMEFFPLLGFLLSRKQRLCSNVPWRTVGARRRVPPAQGSEETWRPCGRYFLRSGDMAQQEEGIWGRRQSLGEPPRPASPSILPSTCPPVFLSPSSHPPVPLSTLFSKALPAAQCLWPESGCILCSFLPSRLPYDPSS